VVRVNICAINQYVGHDIIYVWARRMDQLEKGEGGGYNRSMCFKINIALSYLGVLWFRVRELSTGIFSRVICLNNAF
jgi:hypothetical protein